MIIPVWFWACAAILAWASPAWAAEPGTLAKYGGPLALGVLAVFVFLLLREVNCWYWKINEMLDMQKQILELLKNQSSGQSTAEAVQPARPPSPAPSSLSPVETAPGGEQKKYLDSEAILEVDEKPPARETPTPGRIYLKKGRVVEVDSFRIEKFDVFGRTLGVDLDFPLDQVKRIEAEPKPGLVRVVWPQQH